MKSGRRYLAAGLALLAIALLAVAWMGRHSFSREATETEVGLQGEAFENRTLLLQKWLEAQGWSASRNGGEIKAGKLPGKGTLILLHLSHPLSQREADVLLAWVRGGGHLLTDSSAAPFDDDRGLATLHKAVGVHLGERSPSDSSQTGHGPRIRTFHEGETPYLVNANARWLLYADQPGDWTYRMGSADGFVLLTRAEGEGRLSLNSDLSFVYGASLTMQDHAAFLERLLALRPGKGPVVVWSMPVEQSLFLWLWVHAWAPGLSLLLLIAAWIWKGWCRFGPILPVPADQRRSLREHLVASARFTWSKGGGGQLLRVAREALVVRAIRLNPGYLALDPSDRAEWLALASGGNADAIYTAMDDRPGRPEAHLAQDLLTLERVRHRLKAPAPPTSQDLP